MLLLGVYGDVQRVKILFNKKDAALIQMTSPFQAHTGMLNCLCVAGSAAKGGSYLGLLITAIIAAAVQCLLVELNHWLWGPWFLQQSGNGGGGGGGGGDTPTYPQPNDN